MKLEDVKEEPPPESFKGGKVTIRSGGKLQVMSMEEFGRRMDPITGTLPREFWGAGVGRSDGHLGAVRDDC